MSGELANRYCEDEARRKLADQWMGAHLDQAGMEVYDARAAGEPLDRLRKKYGNEAVEERTRDRRTAATFQEWVNSGYQKPENAKRPPMPKLKTPAKNVLPITHGRPSRDDVPEAVYCRHESGRKAGRGNALLGAAEQDCRGYRRTRRIAGGLQVSPEDRPFQAR